MNACIDAEHAFAQADAQPIVSVEPHRKAITNEMSSERGAPFKDQIL